MQWHCNYFFTDPDIHTKLDGVAVKLIEILIGVFQKLFILSSVSKAMELV